MLFQQVKLVRFCAGRRIGLSSCLQLRHVTRVCAVRGIWIGSSFTQTGRFGLQLLESSRLRRPETNNDRMLPCRLCNMRSSVFPAPT